MSIFDRNRGNRLLQHGMAATGVLMGMIAGMAESPASPVLEKVIRSGELAVVIRYKDPAAGDGLDHAPRVSVLLHGKGVAKVAFPDDVGIPEVFTTEMDPLNGYSEVVVESYSGGAHCCEEIVVFSAPADGVEKVWWKVRLGTFDGGARPPRDLDGDGLSEIMVRDDAFYYVYGCYACSYAPPVILSVRGGRKVDITRRSSFRPVLRREEKRIASRMRQSMTENGGRVENGLLAGYVALRFLLGEGAEGWNFMLKHHVRELQAFCLVTVRPPNPGIDAGTAQ